MPRPSQKNKIMLAALGCFAIRGYRGTRNKHIAEASGTSEAALYRHFKTKEDLAKAIFLNCLSSLNKQLEQITLSSKPTLEKLRDVVRSMLAVYREETNAFRFALLNVYEYMPRVPSKTRYPIDIIEQLIIEGQNSNVIRNGDTRILASIFLGAILRPAMASLAPPGFAPDLLKNREHDETIEEAAIAAISWANSDAHKPRKQG